MNDAELVRKILTRDKKALHTMYRMYAPKLMRYISVKVASYQDAEEILQDTMFSFLEAIRDFHGRAKLTTYLFSICQHKVIDYYRRKKLRHFVFSQMPYLEELVSPLLSPEEELDAAVLKERLKKAFMAILPRYRTVLELKYIESLSVQEIARKIACTFKSTESQLFRARQAFVSAFSLL